MKAFDQIKQIVAGMEKDVTKFDAGQKAAGVRIRAALMDIKNVAHEGRKEVSEANS